MDPFLTAVTAALPDDHAAATLAGRVWRPDVAGPSVVAIRNGAAIDITASFATMRDLCEHPDPAAALHAATGESLGPVSDILARQTALAPQTPHPFAQRCLPWLHSGSATYCT